MPPTSMLSVKISCTVLLVLKSSATHFLIISIFFRYCNTKEKKSESMLYWVPSDQTTEPLPKTNWLIESRAYLTWGFKSNQNKANMRKTEWWHSIAKYFCKHYIPFYIFKGVVLKRRRRRCINPLRTSRRRAVSRAAEGSACENTHNARTKLIFVLILFGAKTFTYFFYLYNVFLSDCFI